MRKIKRLLPALAFCALAAGLSAPAALASTTQQSIIEDDVALHTNMTGTLATMRELGATTVKVAVYWNSLAPNPNSSKEPKNFSPTNPADYVNWGFYDALVRQATSDGLKVGFMPTSPVPKWALGPGDPRGSHIYTDEWKPSATLFGDFVKAIGKRYDGTYIPAGQALPLPAVHWWSIWNEPNYGPDLAPQAIDNNTVYEGADMYRGLLNSAWNALAATGHKTSNNTILIGETAPRGVVGRGFPGSGSGTVPITFIQSLYCVNGSDQELTGTAAAKNGCPGNAGKFRSQNPALFASSGFAAHPYAQGTPPNVPTYQCGINKFCFNAKTKRSSPGYADFAEVGRLENLLHRVTGKSVPVWNTEFGYWTNPPDRARGSLPVSTASLYMNWAEYLSYKNPIWASYSQYLLVDPSSGEFADGLELAGGQHLANFDAFEVPLYLPTTSAGHASSLEVWGGVRPAGYSLAPTLAQIQFQPGSRGAFKTVQMVTITNSRGYFDVHQAFTQSGSVRIAWTPAGGATVYSRTQTIKIK